MDSAQRFAQRQPTSNNNQQPSNQATHQQPLSRELQIQLLQTMRATIHQRQMTRSQNFFIGSAGITILGLCGKLIGLDKETSSLLAVGGVISMAVAGLFLYYLNYVKK